MIDPAPPAVAPLTGTLVAPGWHSGVEPVNLSATDASGVKSLSLVAGDTRLLDSQQTCDYSRMQPCPASLQQTVSVDTAKLTDGTYELKETATDAADQPGTQTATLKVDRHAPEKPTDLAVERNPDGTLAFAWTNPDQGTAAPISGARYEVCDALGVGCVAGGLIAGPNIARLGAVSIPAGEHVVRVWLQDEAGNADSAGAATITVDPSTITARRTVETNPPVLESGPAPSASLRITKARQNGSTLTLTGTIAKKATATLTARVSKGRTTKTLATAKTKPKAGKWTLKVKLTSTLRRSNTMYVRVAFAGQSSYAKATALRKLSKRPKSSGNTAQEFSLESRSAG